MKLIKSTISSGMTRREMLKAFTLGGLAVAVGGTFGIMKVCEGMSNRSDRSFSAAASGQVEFNKKRSGKRVHLRKGKQPGKFTQTRLTKRNFPKKRGRV